MMPHLMRWVVLFAVVAGYAQSPTGEIAGVVRDSSGAVVPNVAITVTSQNTSERKSATSNEAGEFVVPQHKPPQPAADPLPRLTPQNVPVGQDLRTRLVPLSREEAEVFCREKQNESLPCFYGDSAHIHPAWYANQPIYWLHHSFSYGPAIHTASRVQHRRGAQVGQTLVVAGHCVDAFERKGHQYIVNDVEIRDAAGVSIAAIRHTAIYQVARTL